MNKFLWHLISCTKLKLSFQGTFYLIACYLISCYLNLSLLLVKRGLSSMFGLKAFLNYMCIKTDAYVFIACVFAHQSIIKRKLIIYLFFAPQSLSAMFVCLRNLHVESWSLKYSACIKCLFVVYFFIFMCLVLQDEFTSVWASVRSDHCSWILNLMNQGLCNYLSEHVELVKSCCCSPQSEMLCLGDQVRHDFILAATVGA